MPWCIQKCPYCDFNSHAVKTPLPEEHYISILLADLAYDIQRFEIDRPLESIFIGGGTPSLFSANSISILLEGIFKQLSVTNAIEITLEANPSTFEQEKFSAFRAAGINRLSIGVQSFHAHHLRALGRIHNGHDALKAAEMARNVGFDNFNLDLMFGLPQQTLVEAVADIKHAIDLAPTHLSLYQLTLEPNTYFHKFPPKLPEDEHIFTWQTHCQQQLANAEFTHYEVSAYAQEGFQCRHNLNYWQFGDYLGIGAGAQGKITQQLPEAIYRTSKRKQPQAYLDEIRSETQLIPIKALPLEFMMNQLRLKKGFSLTHYQKMTGLPESTLKTILNVAVTEKLLSRSAKNYVCTSKGWNFLDTLLEKFIA
jgi:oxygen-independent coproporphyrinogen-3 oxidase